MKHILIISFILLSFFGKAQDNNSLLWKVYQQGKTDTSFLYGSIHIKDKRVFDVNRHFNRVFEKSNTVALELHFDSINPFQLMNFIMMEDGKTLKNVMDSSKYKVVKSFFEDTLKTSIQYIERFQPIYTSTLLGEMKNTAVDSNMNDKFLDEKFFSDAKSAGKSLIGLEKMEEQMQAFGSLPYTVQAELLYETVKETNKNPEVNPIEELILMYINQDLNSISEYINDFNQSNSETIQPYEQLLKEKLLDERNLRMVSRSMQLVKTGNTLIIVGAAHLPGELGLIELYRKRGFIVEPLK